MEAKKFLAIAGGVVLLSFCACVGVGALSEPTEQEAAVAESTDAPAEPATTNTEAPTATSEPTSTPRPTATETSPDADELAYASEMIDLLDDYQEDALYMAMLFDLVAEDPEFLLLDEWIDEFKLTANSIRTTNRRIRALDPPPRLVDVHADMVASTESMDKALDDIEFGIDTLDVSYLERGITHLEDAFEYMGSATDKLDQMD